MHCCLLTRTAASTVAALMIVDRVIATCDLATVVYNCFFSGPEHHNAAYVAALYQPCDANQVQATLEAADSGGDNDGGLSFHEFVHMISGGHVTVCNQMQSQLSEMRELFSLVDPNGDGSGANSKNSACRVSIYSVLTSTTIQSQ